MDGYYHLTRALHWTEECNNSKFVYKGKEITKIAQTLHVIFSIMIVVRDYILADALTPLDIFEGLPLSSEDIYRILYYLPHCGPFDFSLGRRRIFTDLFNTENKPFAISMLGEKAEDSIKMKYYYRPPYFVLGHTSYTDTLDEEKGSDIRRILDKKDVSRDIEMRYGVDEKICREVYEVGMIMKHSLSLPWKIESPLPLHMIFLMFMNPEDVRINYSAISMNIHEERGRTNTDVLDKCLNSRQDMMRELHRYGILILDAQKLLSDLASFGDESYSALGESYVKRRLWISMKYLLRLHVKVIEEGEFSSTVEYEGCQYAVGMRDGGRVILRRGSYIQPLYEFVDSSGGRSVTAYEVMLLASALRFTTTPTDTNNALFMVEKLYEQCYGEWKSRRNILSGFGVSGVETIDPIRDFIIPNMNFPCY